jgi:methylated-DNA-[protein]-cysteine S-methyltransferase
MLLADREARGPRRGAQAELSPAPRLVCDSPFGFLTLVEEQGRIGALEWGGRAAGKPSPALADAKRQLAAYFAGKRREFDLPLAPQGSAGERLVWQALIDIPYGKTRSYGELARELGLSPRHVGQACGRNPIPILIPCHRVVAADGALTGFSAPGGIETKRRLLQLEGALLV